MVCRVPSDVNGAQTFLDWWMVNYRFPSRLHVAMRWLNTTKGRGIWFDLLNHNVITTAQRILLTQKRDASADMRELSLLADWVVTQQMAILRNGYHTRSDLVRFGID
jgi:hypothetical protein